jgi:branched-chain amino acid transport system permease protein
MLTGSMFVSGLINGLCLAGIYILIALGITLILSIMNILQFAHGEVYMLGAFFTYFLATAFGVNIFVAILVSMIVTGLLGLILQRIIFRPLLGKFLPVVCAATGLGLILQTLAVLGFGLDAKHIPVIWPGTLKMLSWTISLDRIGALFAGIILMAAVLIFLKNSKYGQAIVATAQDSEAALLQGVNPNLMYALGMIIGSALAAVGGSFAGSIFILDPFMGGTALFKGITIIIIGGIGSLNGVIIGALILGLCDSIVAVAFGSEIAAIVPLVIVIFILIIRPQGLFGHE